MMLLVVGSRSDVGHSSRLEPSNLSLKPQHSVPSIKDKVKAEEVAAAAAASVRLDTTNKHPSSNEARIRYNHMCLPSHLFTSPK